MLFMEKMKMELENLKERKFMRRREIQIEIRSPSLVVVGQNYSPCQNHQETACGP